MSAATVTKALAERASWSWPRSVLVPIVFGAVGHGSAAEVTAAVSSSYSGCLPGPLTSIFSNIGKVTP